MPAKSSKTTKQSGTSKPVINVEGAEPKAIAKAEHISEYVITVNPNDKDLDVNTAGELRDQLFGELDGEDISRWLKFSSGDMSDVISVDVKLGKIELQPTRGVPHWHAHVIITHTALLQLDFAKIQREVKGLYGNTTYCTIKRHNNYSSAAKNYVNK